LDCDIHSVVLGTLSKSCLATVLIESIKRNKCTYVDEMFVDELTYLDSSAM
jgi:hypothetical protein